MEKNSFDLKKEFEKLRPKYSLPDFSKLSEDFDIEKISDKETSFILREIRRAISEKISAYLHLLENLINPNSPPVFLLNIIRKFNTEEKETIRQLYRSFSSIQIKVMNLDTIYSEKEEAEFIKFAFKEWQDYKKSIHKLISSFESKLDDTSQTNQRGYFG